MSGALALLARLRGEQTILARASRGAFWLAGCGAAERLIRFGRNVVLVRLLAREDFGLMSTALLVCAALEAFSEVGFRQCLIRHKDGATVDFMNAIWWLSAVRSVILFGLGFAAVPLICAFLRRPDLLAVIRISLLAPLFTGFQSPGVHALEKEMNYKRWAILKNATSAVTVVLTVGMALAYPTVLVLAWGYAAEGFVRAALSFVACPLVPRASLRKRCVADILIFARGTLGTPVLFLLVVQAEVLVIGKMFGMTALGGYALAVSLGAVLTDALVRIVSPLLLPALAQMQDDLPRLRAAIYRTSRFIAVVSVPCVAFVAMASSQILTVLYGRSFADLSLVLVLVALYHWMRLVGPVLSSTLLVLGKPHLDRRFMLVRALVLAVLVFPAARYAGVPGVVLSQITALAVAYVYLVWIVGRLTGLAPTRYLAGILRPIGLGGMAVVAVRAWVLTAAPRSGWVLAVGAVLAAGTLVWGLSRCLVVQGLAVPRASAPAAP